MKVSQLFGNAGIKYPQDAENIEISGIVTDSRDASDGCVFICIKGGQHNGHEHIKEAILAGAKVIVAEQVRDEGVGGAATIYVENTRSAAALLYNAWYGDPARDMKLIAVTGTNGKTSVNSILKAIFESDGHRSGLIGTVGCMSGDKHLETFAKDPNANMTTPDPSELYRLLSIMREDGVEYVFMEASSHALEYSKLDALYFDSALFTNLTQDHLDFHVSMENYFKAKAKLFGRCRRAIINIDDNWSDGVICACQTKEIYTVSTEKEADFSASGIKSLGVYGSEFTLRYPDGEMNIKISLAGNFFVKNTALAASTALVYGISPEKIVEALHNIVGIDGRMEQVELSERAEISVFIDYAHTPDALENLLRGIIALKKERRQRTILVFGCGGDRDRSKRAQMAQIASRLADVIVITSDNSRSESIERIFSDILKGIEKEKEYCIIPDRAEAIEYAVRVARAGDIVVLAGKGHERYEIDNTGKHPFDERKIVKEAYNKYYIDN